MVERAQLTLNQEIAVQIRVRVPIFQSILEQ
ncbi:MAG: hypothetical protein ACI9R3_005986 [Verrucomicrobiales bacterium]|jgi:hypothetical protein